MLSAISQRLETLRRDIALASDVQKHLLPEAAPRGEFADFAAVSVPARGRRTEADPAQPEIEQLSVGGTVVGMFPEMGYEEATVELHPGDVLLAFTDGVPETHNPEDEEFGEERLQQLLRETAHLPASEIGGRISAAMQDWIRDAEQYDDLTFVVMKVR